MIFLSGVEGGQRDNLGHYWIAEVGRRQFLRGFGSLLLRIIVIKNHRAVLGAVIGALAVESRRVVSGPKDFQQLIVGNDRRIVLDLNYLRMTSQAGAKLRV